MSAPSQRYEHEGMVGHQPGGSESSSHDTNPQLEEYVVQNITRLERLLKKEHSARGQEDDIRNLLVWWSENQAFFRMLMPEGRLRRAITERSFGPLLAPIPSLGQIERLERLVSERGGEIRALAQRFIEGPGKHPSHSQLVQELQTKILGKMDQGKVILESELDIFLHELMQRRQVASKQTR